MRYILGSLVGATVLGFAGAPAALAADMAVKAPKLVVAADPWTGSYVGLSAGGAVERSCGRYEGEGFLDPDGFNPTFLNSFVSGCSSSTGFIGGAQGGYNQKIGRWVWGVEGDFSGLSTKTSRTASATSPSSGFTYVDTRTTTLDMLATVRARFGGLITDNTLLYITGGLATAHVDASDSAIGITVPPPGYIGAGSVSQWVPGWVAGVGAETKIGGGPWSVKAEYLYVGLNSVYYDTRQVPATYQGNYTNVAGLLPTSTQLHVFRVGANYSFGAPRGANAYASAGPVVYNWSGFYAGAHVGEVRGSTRSQEPATEAQPGAGPWIAFGDVIDSKTSGIVGGAQAGYNWQMNSVVLGLEGDFGYLGAAGVGHEVNFSGTMVNAAGGGYGTFRGRAGFAWDRVLVYATGGLMVADVGASYRSPAAITLGDGLIYSDRTGTQTGWTVGGGIEVAVMDGWSVKGEYLHYDLGTKRVYGNWVNPGLGSLPYLYAFDIANKGDMVRIGFNHHFDFGGPVVARY